MDRKIHHTGTQKSDIEMPVSTFYTLLQAVLMDHVPAPGLKEPKIRLPKGFWISYVSESEEPITIN